MARQVQAIPKEAMTLGSIRSDKPPGQGRKSGHHQGLRYQDHSGTLGAEAL